MAALTTRQHYEHTNQLDRHFTSLGLVSIFRNVRKYWSPAHGAGNLFWCNKKKVSELIKLDFDGKLSKL